MVRSLSLIVVTLFLLAVSVTAWRPINHKTAVAFLLAAGLQIAAPSSALAVVDCVKDCQKNCLIAAPKSGEYCISSCDEYCADPDREDGLSGSKSDKRGETGLFGGSIDGTTIKDLPPKSPINFIPERLSVRYGESTSRMSRDALHE